MSGVSSALNPPLRLRMSPFFRFLWRLMTLELLALILLLGDEKCPEKLNSHTLDLLVTSLVLLGQYRYLN